MNRLILGRLFTSRVLIFAQIMLATARLAAAQTGARVAAPVARSQRDLAPTGKVSAAAMGRPLLTLIQENSHPLVSKHGVTDSGLPVYDDFNERWLSPAKWQPVLPNCWGNVLECVRQIRDGKLYLAVRNFGDSNSDTGIDYSESEVFFRNQSAVRSIAADVSVQNYAGKGCSTNNTDNNQTQVRMGGAFFNSGSGTAFDDVTAVIVFLVDVSDPRTITVGGWWGWEDQGNWNFIASYPVGTSLRGSIRWDKENRQFVASVTAADGTGGTAVMPYTVLETAPPVTANKKLDATLFTLNCTSTQTFGEVEATFDNVMINQ